MSAWITSQTEQRREKKMYKTLIQLAVVIVAVILSVGSSKRNTTKRPTHHGPEAQCKNGDAHACMYLGRIHFEKGNYKLAYGHLKTGCLNRHAESCRHLGEMWKDGFGVQKDLHRALKYHRLACRLKDGDGCFYAGEILDDYLGGGEVNKKLALQFYRKGCELGERVSCNTLRVQAKALQAIEATCLELAKMTKRGISYICKRLGYCARVLEIHARILEIYPKRIKKLRAYGNQYWKKVWSRCKRLPFPPTGLDQIYNARGLYSICKKAFRFFAHNKPVVAKLYILYKKRSRIINKQYMTLIKQLRKQRLSIYRRKRRAEFWRAVAANNRARSRSHSPATYACHWRCCAFGCSKPRGYATVVAKSSTDAWSKVKRVFNFSTFFTCKNQYGRTGTPTIRCRRR